MTNETSSLLKKASVGLSFSGISAVFLWNLWASMDSRVDGNAVTIMANSQKVDALKDDFRDIKIMQKEIRGDVKKILFKLNSRGHHVNK